MLFFVLKLYTLDEKSNLQISTLQRFAPIAWVVVAKFAHFVQTWQPPLLQRVQTHTKSIFATGLRKANFVQIRFFIQCIKLRTKNNIKLNFFKIDSFPRS